MSVTAKRMQFELLKANLLIAPLAKLAGLRLYLFSSVIIKLIDGHVAQLDRASDSGSEGRGFESLHAR